MTAPPKPGELRYRASKLGSDGCIHRWDYDTAEERAKHHRATGCVFRRVRILPARPKLHGFEWALKQMKAGKVVCLASNPDMRLRHAHNRIMIWIRDDEWMEHRNFFTRDLMATDWLLAPTEAP